MKSSECRSPSTKKAQRVKEKSSDVFGKHAQHCHPPGSPTGRSRHQLDIVLGLLLVNVVLQGCEESCPAELDALGPPHHALDDLDVQILEVALFLQNLSRVKGGSVIEQTAIAAGAKTTHISEGEVVVAAPLLISGIEISTRCPKLDGRT